MSQIKLVIADDHGIFIHGLRQILEEDNDIQILAEASNGLEAIEKVKEHQPDILLLDISMPKMGGLETAAIIDKQYKKTKALILSMHNNEDYINKAIENGAYGYLLKDATKEEVLSAIHKVADGERYFGNSISDIIVESYVRRAKNKDLPEIKKKAALSKKEKQILKMIIDGQNSREIAEQLELSIRTVDNHRANMMKRNNVKNAAELVKLAVENKWI